MEQTVPQTQTITAPKDRTLTAFGFGLIIVGLIVFLLGPQNLTLVFEGNLTNASASVGVLLLFCGVGFCFVLGSLLYKRRIG